VAAISDVRDISKIAYGFMGSQALVAALDLELFGHLSSGPLGIGALSEATGIRADRLEMLLVPLTALGLLVNDAGQYGNASATQKYLVPGAPEYFGEYIRLQVGKQIYPHAMKVGRMLDGAPARLYEEVADSGEKAADFSHSQHLGSLGPAHLLARSVSLDNPQRLLDVAGGSGAFTIALCRRYPELEAKILDFPAVIDVARHYIAEAGIADRVDFIAGNALQADWPDDNDVVLMSYLLSAVGRDEIRQFLDMALAALSPGGRLVIHDFMADDDKTGPATAALWMMVLAGSEDPVCLTEAELSARLEAAGFHNLSGGVLVPTITRFLVASKPA
jgi:SAM-dependent methyltransferase